MLKISLVCATIDSAAEINELIRSIQMARSDFEEDIDVELIIIDQNDEPVSSLLCQPTGLTVIYHHSQVRGLSRNRNLGVGLARGDWLMCIDADCRVDVAFFTELSKLIAANPVCGAFIGRILACEDGSPIFRRWPKEERIIGSFFTWQLATSVNCVSRRIEGHLFDESFGLGARFGSCEDVDFLVRMGCRKLYSPTILTYHPFQDNVSVPMGKAVSYSFGFGALCRKHLLPLGGLFLLATSVKKIVELLSGRIGLRLFVGTVRSRVYGFLEYGRQK